MLLDLLRLGAYQLLRTRVEPHAAVDTTVEQAGIEFDTARAGFVNGVLRTIARRDEASWVAELAPPPDTDPIGHLAFTHAHPRWIAQAFADALGADAGELGALLASDDERPLVHLAARPGVLTADELAQAVDGTVGRYSPYAVYLAGGDPGSARARARRLGAGAGRGQPAGRAGADARTRRRRVTVAGSTCARGRAARRRCWPRIGAASGARVTAVEPTPHRAELVEQNIRGLDVDVLRVDGRESGLAPASFDRVLVDAPCTGLGALRRRPEARWRRQPGDVPALAKLQRELLASAIALTRPGGVVLYATCSPHLAETVGVVARRPASSSRTRDRRPAVVRSRRPTSARDRTCSCGRIGTARMRCSRRPCRCGSERLREEQIMTSQQVR